MKVTVITAVRNAAATIGATLDSVAAQTLADVEHIVVDGASNDSTLEVVRQRGASVARVVSEPDHGVYDAYNKGLALATGDVVGFLNAGDVYASPDVLERVLRELRAPGTRAVFGDVLIVDPADRARVLRHYRSGRFAPSRLAYGISPAHPTLYMHRDVYRRFGGYDPSYVIAGDFELCVRVFLQGHVRYRYLPEVLVLMTGGGLSDRGWRGKWQNTKEMRRACTSNGVPTSLLKLSTRLPVKIGEMLWHAH